MMDERKAGRMERVAPRAFELFLGRAPGSEAAHESARGRRVAPDQEDARLIAQLLHSAAVASTGRDAVLCSLREEVDSIASNLVQRAQAALIKLRGRDAAAALTDADITALESVLQVRGRPALRVEDARLQALDPVNHPDWELWSDVIADFETRIVAAASATGAVRSRFRWMSGPPTLRGTAWLIAPDLAITNRHVMLSPGEMFAPIVRSKSDVHCATLKDGVEITVDFAFDSGKERDMSRVVTRIPFLALDLDPVDVAIVQLAEPINSARCLRLADTELSRRSLYVIGHPGPLQHVSQREQVVFGNPDGRKRVSFGQRMIAGGAGSNELHYDASTMGGYSGGCVLQVDSTEVSALHFYGDPLRGNRGILAATLRCHPVSRFFLL